MLFVWDAEPPDIAQRLRELGVEVPVCAPSDRSEQPAENGRFMIDVIVVRVGPTG